MFGRIRHLGIIIGFLAVFLCGYVRGGQNAEQLVNRLISGVDDNTEKSRIFYKAAVELSRGTRTRIILLEKAVMYGMDRNNTAGGCEIAEDALEEMIKLNSGDKPDLLDKKCKLYAKWLALITGAKERKEIRKRWLESLVELADAYADADKWLKAGRAYRQAGTLSENMGDSKMNRELDESMQRAFRMAQICTKAKSMARTLKSNPDNATLREELITVYLVEMNAPGKALSYVNASVDEVLATYVPLAAKQISKLAEGNCRELGHWYYKTLLPQASKQARLHILNRAYDYYSRFLELHKKNDVNALKVKSSLQSVKKQLEKYDPLYEFKQFIRGVKVISASYNLNYAAEIWIGEKMIYNSERFPREYGIILVACHNKKISKPRIYKTYYYESEANRLAADIESLPQGAFVILAVRGSGFRGFNNRAYRAIQSIGGKINLKLHYSKQYYCIGMKGMQSGQALEASSEDSVGYPAEIQKKLSIRR